MRSRSRASSSWLIGRSRIAVISFGCIVVFLRRVVEPVRLSYCGDAAVRTFSTSTAHQLGISCQRFAVGKPAQPSGWGRTDWRLARHGDDRDRTLELAFHLVR